jgi:hypothetical protein
MSKKPKAFNLASQIRGQLRLVFRRSPWHRAAMQAARVEKKWYKSDGRLAKKPAVWYKCAECENLFKPNFVEVDHLYKVGPAPGTKYATDSITWDSFILRMFCNTAHLRVLCKPCHRINTNKGL